DAGRTAGTRPLRCRGGALGPRTAKAPARGLSALNDMAFGLAVYASPDGLPRRDGKLACSRWSICCASLRPASGEGRSAAWGQDSHRRSGGELACALVRQTLGGPARRSV